MDRNDVIGTGSYGTIVRESNNTAIKIIPHHSDMLQFPLEISIMATYSHPHLNKAKKVKYKTDRIEIYQNLAHCSLRDYTVSGRDLPRPLIERWLFELISAIGLLHDNNIIHGDVKPKNILLFDNLHLKLTDFGHATLIPDMPIPREPLGTLSYNSPEQLLTGLWDTSADIWAYGCIGYELITGHILSPSQRKKKGNPKRYEERHKTAKALQDWRKGLGDEVEPLLGSFHHVPINNLIGNTDPLERLIVKCTRWYGCTRPKASRILASKLFRNKHKIGYHVKHDRVKSDENESKLSANEVQIYLKERNLTKLDKRIQQELTNIYSRVRVQIIGVKKIYLIEACIIIVFLMFHYPTSQFHTVKRVEKIKEIIIKVYDVLEYRIHSS